MSRSEDKQYLPRQGTWSVYIHFPWCLKRCAYCDFATAVSAQIPREQYLQAILAELALRTGEIEKAPIATVFFGGGTPSLWGPGPVGEVLAWLDRWAGLQPGAEITLEANPGAAEEGDLRGYLSAGINRISLGVQALDDQRLLRLDRVHDAAAARRTLHLLGEWVAGGQLQSASADLLFGAPDQGAAQLQADVAGVLDCGLPHLSAYALTVEEGTPLHTRVERGLQSPPDDDLQMTMLAKIPDLVGQYGLERYEVSNFAKPGHRSRHNMVYWQGGHYLAAGVGAHGYLPTAQGEMRYGNTRQHRDYLAGLGRTQGPELAEALRETVTPEMHLAELLLTGLRLDEGLALESVRRDCGDQALQRLLVSLERAKAAGLPVLSDGQRLWVPAHATERLDAVIRALA
jgi:oxygen-independent coproporphyrinogen-3 oxidase